MAFAIIMDPVVTLPFKLVDEMIWIYHLHVEQVAELSAWSREKEAPVGAMVWILSAAIDGDGELVVGHFMQRLLLVIYFVFKSTEAVDLRFLRDSAYAARVI